MCRPRRFKEMSNFYETYHLQQFGKTLHPLSEPMSDQPQIKSNRIIVICPPIKATTHLSQISPTPLFAKANQQETTSPNFQRIPPTTTGLKPQSLEKQYQPRHAIWTTQQSQPSHPQQAQRSTLAIRQPGLRNSNPPSKRTNTHSKI